MKKREAIAAGPVCRPDIRPPGVVLRERICRQGRHFIGTPRAGPFFKPASVKSVRI